VSVGTFPLLAKLCFSGCAELSYNMAFVQSAAACEISPRLAAGRGDQEQPPRQKTLLHPAQLGCVDGKEVQFVVTAGYIYVQFRLWMSILVTSDNHLRLQIFRT
jgi:hypothetical protein